MGFLPQWVVEGLHEAASIQRTTLLAVLATYFASILVYGLRLSLVLRYLGYRVRFKDCVIAYLLSFFVNNITPAARAGGEIVRVTYLSNMLGLNQAGRLINVVAFERVTESIAIALLAILVIIGGIIPSSPLPLLLLIGLAVLGVVVVERYWDRVFEKIAFRLPERYRELLGLSSLSDPAASIRVLIRNPFLFVFSTLLGACVWLLDALRIYYIASGLGYRLAFVEAVAVSLLYLAIGLIAITPGGLGIVEGGLTAALSSMGVPLRVALAVTLIERLISYGLGTLLGALALVSVGGREAWRRLRSQ